MGTWKRKQKPNQRQRRHRQSMNCVREVAKLPQADVERQTEAESIARHCAELTAQLELDSESQKSAVLSLRGSVWKYSKDKVGCRVVQKAFDVAPRPLADELVIELHGHVREAIDSPHANYVIQHIVDVLPIGPTAFVAEEIIGLAAAQARHRYGCRVLIRLLEHSAGLVGTERLVDELMGEASALARHSFGHFVLQAVLEHGLAHHRHGIVLALHGQDADKDGMLLNAMNRHGSTVFESAMLHCSEQDKESICRGLLSRQDYVPQLAQSQFGRFVLRTLLRYPNDYQQMAWHILSDASPEFHAWYEAG